MGQKDLARRNDMPFKTITVEVKEDRIGFVTLNRPERKNAISVEMRKALSDLLRGWKDDPGIGVVIFTGSGDTFTAGFDLSEFKNPALLAEIFETSARYHRDLWYFPKPTIAAINGPALAGGFDFVKLCDVRICSPKAIFGHPEVKFGIPPLFTPLRWIVGEGSARDLCFTGRRIDGAEAHRIGLVSELVPEERLLEKAMEFARVMLEAPVAALRQGKEFMVNCQGRDFESSFSVEHDVVFQEFLLKKSSEALSKKG
jgi:enoyl-CoA hydratase